MQFVVPLKATQTEFQACEGHHEHEIESQHNLIDCLL